VPCASTTEHRSVHGRPRYQRYFQELDKALYAKVLEKRLLHAIVEFLDSRGIDTSEFNERKQTIENHGVYVADGGTFTADSVAAGQGARATAKKKR
jgi:hypothetical protein